jgi:glycosyltransferase involved in cell wall biosynthesis
MLVHDWLTGMRGGEKVLSALCKMYPSAPIKTLLYVQGSVSSQISSHEIDSSLLQYMPGAAKQYRHYVALFPLFAELNKAHASELIVSTSHAVAKSMVRRRGGRPLHICYIHTPMRYAWDLFEDYFGVERKGWFMSRCVYRPIFKVLQIYDRATTGRVDLFVANSAYIAERVKRIYSREAAVIPPPVDVERFFPLKREPEDWYLVVSALVPYKKVADAIRACHRLGRSLKIIGSGPELESLRSLAIELSASVEVLGSLDDTAVASHYARAKALLFPGIEDFGIVPVEAIASGCPVIAYAKGGILDSMTEKTAVFYTEQTVDSLVGGLRAFEERAASFDVSEMRSHARSFTEEEFCKSFAAVVSGLQVEA